MYPTLGRPQGGKKISPYITDKYLRSGFPGLKRLGSSIWPLLELKLHGGPDVVVLVQDLKPHAECNPALGPGASMLSRTWHAGSNLTHASRANVLGLAMGQSHAPAWYGMMLVSRAPHGSGNWMTGEEDKRRGTQGKRQCCTTATTINAATAPLYFVLPNF